jgi:hypothetical protein
MNKSKFELRIRVMGDGTVIINKDGRRKTSETYNDIYTEKQLASCVNSFVGSSSLMFFGSGDASQAINEVMRQLDNKTSETAYGEPQAFILAANGHSIEVTLEQAGLSKYEYFYSCCVHCSTKEFDDGKFNFTGGIIDTFSTRSANRIRLYDCLESALLSAERV